MTHPLISVPELHEKLSEVALFDLRWDLTDPDGGRGRYLAGHIPGAVFVDLDVDLAAPTGAGRHPLPDPVDFAATLGHLGVGSYTDVVVYDDAGGSVAARMWWMLGAIGHRGTARVLDGGWRAWVEAGYETSTADVEPAAVHYPRPSGGYRGVVDQEGVASARAHLLLDARAPERYLGETEPVDPRAGHIPGALNTPWQGNLDESGRFKDATALRRRYTALGADRRPVIVSCGSGVNAAHLALSMQLAGLPRPLLYAGSFSDWARSDRPVAEGPHPG
ncbi:MAG TPA: sulfurtransferase [Acidimicrobiia bacterium]|nr:sulfurtransferase [Acidimicrobiia bacterium]